MSTRALLIPLFGRTSRSGHSDLRRRLRLEALEDRLAPATLTVNSTADTASPTDPYLSLREAIAVVNSPSLPGGLSDQILGQISGTLHDGGADTIAFDLDSVTSPIILRGGQLELTLPASTAGVTIDGGAGVTLDGNRTSRVIQMDGPVLATFQNLTITHGSDRNQGGGVYNLGTLTVSGCTITSNGSDRGGGIYNTGALAVSDSALTANGVSGLGGGIYNTGTVTISDSALTRNDGGPHSAGAGISNLGTLTLTGSTVSNNGAYSAGGLANSGTATVTDCTFSGNSGTLPGAGAIANSGTLTVCRAAFLSNSCADGGGGILNLAVATVADSTFSGNQAFFGGGIANRAGTLTLSNSTLFANSTADYGGGLYSSGGSLTVTNCTLAANSSRYQGGGMYIVSGTPRLHDTLLAGNRSPSIPDIGGAVDSASSYNLIGIADSTFSGISDGSQGNQIGTLASPIDSLLGPLGDYGGPTQTMPLLSGSPALNAGDPSLAGTPDQRGVGRSGGVNIGAFQASAAFFIVTAADMATAGVPFDVGVAVYDEFGQLAVGYTGTITFSTTDPDPAVVLPPDYTFQASDGGMITFAAGVTLFTPGDQTLTVTDLGSGITGNTIVTL
jgi:hypothetical protein